MLSLFLYNVMILGGALLMTLMGLGVVFLLIALMIYIEKKWGFVASMALLLVSLTILAGLATSALGVRV